MHGDGRDRRAFVFAGRWLARGNQLRIAIKPLQGVGRVVVSDDLILRVPQTASRGPPATSAKRKTGGPPPTPT
jgi:hypothetical protein